MNDYFQMKYYIAIVGCVLGLLIGIIVGIACGIEKIKTKIEKRRREKSAAMEEAEKASKDS